MTFAEFLVLPDPPTGHYELHHGEVVLMPPRKRLHVKIQQALLELLLSLRQRIHDDRISIPPRAGV
jgi:Uma2 family endonuclease